MVQPKESGGQGMPATTSATIEEDSILVGTGRGSPPWTLRLRKGPLTS